MSAGLHRLIVSVSSIDAALALYRGVLGLRLTGRSGELAWLRTDDGTELMLHERPAEASDAAVAIAFAVEDLEGTVARWEAAGGTVLDAPITQPWGERMAVVRDADGHIVCLNARDAGDTSD
ncbi:hypothetical protein BMH32_03430 [Leucobacter sp. OLJS4]|uniref:VOC family protein n=1 Tax=unclassified Leucobacter TaxID=2621730 RepID=UPI000C19A848|nr:MULTISPECIES: VOC family protein [unclassified Leucobacter]PIJ54611.1 hypothetical protein BMH30_02055 [Leucobacter sp. OLES1]PII83265.1 hypothetical protein BMH25_07445 [Leucobacter sp. OLCALW19]PII86816.1 hypothetical protein BMH26_10820 [Leucobacter sp. OLTLW20]PII91248.1 hypothetical protein BMH27_08410 [Leucobacter sp. OLAS13]PII96860.1 hypothetical protein BMH28_14245 [Leucobacter sp. OLCS4]